MTNLITPNLIQEAFESAVLARGLALQRAGNVKAAKLVNSRGNAQLYQAEVIGSRATATQRTSSLHRIPFTAIAIVLMARSVSTERLLP